MIYAAALSPNSEVLATGGYPPVSRGNITLFDSWTGRILRILQSARVAHRGREELNPLPFRQS